jgi:hypothetical protein
VCSSRGGDDLARVAPGLKRVIEEISETSYSTWLSWNSSGGFQGTSSELAPTPAPLAAWAAGMSRYSGDHSQFLEDHLARYAHANRRLYRR